MLICRKNHSGKNTVRMLTEKMVVAKSERTQAQTASVDALSLDPSAPEALTSGGSILQRPASLSGYS
jgi:hypothetical protein